MAEFGTAHGVRLKPDTTAGYPIAIRSNCS